MSSISENLFHGRLRSSSTRLLWLGIAMLVMGLVALAFPVVPTIAVALLVGWVFLVSGVITLMGAFSIHGTGPFFGALVLSLLSIVSGAFLIFNPLAGAVALTLLVGVVFSFQGAFEIFFAFETRPHQGWVGMLISGIASVIMAVLIAAGWPAISLVVLGILLGVNLITTGVGYIMVSRSLKPN
jgi:uncharacterized membrane protein HdeD (DUF308 family)